MHVLLLKGILRFYISRAAAIRCKIFRQHLVCHFLRCPCPRPRYAGKRTSLDDVDLTSMEAVEHGLLVLGNVPPGMEGLLEIFLLLLRFGIRLPLNEHALCCFRF